MSTSTISARVSARQRILDAAEELFAAQGFHQTQISDIVKAASTGNGTFYKHFATKQDILEELISEFSTHLRRRLQKMRASITAQTALERYITVHQNYRLYFESIFDRPTIATIMFGLGYSASPQIKSLMQGFVQDFCDDIVQDLEKVEAQDMARVPDKKLVANALAGMAFQVGQTMIEDQDLDVDRAVRACANFAAVGLAIFSTDDSFEMILPSLRVLMQG